MRGLRAPYAAPEPTFVIGGLGSTGAGGGAVRTFPSLAQMGALYFSPWSELREKQQHRNGPGTQL